MKIYGLLGKSLSHSFSKNYFTEKFNKGSIKDACYELFELKQISDFPGFIKNNPDIIGLNVTIPYKESIIPYLDELDEMAEEVGAVNTIKVQSSVVAPLNPPPAGGGTFPSYIPAGNSGVGRFSPPRGELEGGFSKLIGYNTDVVGFKESLLKFLPGDSSENFKAMILGTGGGAKAVKVVFKNLGIDYQLVSRQKLSPQSTVNNPQSAVNNPQSAVNNPQSAVNNPQPAPSLTQYIYDELNEEILKQCKLIINTTPLGMFPDVNICPEIPYQAIDHSHFLFDLVYNPEETLFLRKGKERGAKIKNGLEMLYLQAEKSWEIWNR